MQTLSLESIRADVEAKLDLPVVPSIAGRVMSELTNPMSSAEQLGTIIKHDQALMGRILRVANSVVYRRQIPTTTLDAAVVRLGRGLVKDLVISLSTKSLFRKFDPLEEQMWNHSIAVAIASQHLAAFSAEIDPAEAFASGLLHDVGKKIIADKEPQRFLRATQRSIDEGLPSIVTEKEEFGFHHAAVGGVLLNAWKLSQKQIDAVYFHHIDNLDLVPESSRALVSVIILADKIINSLAINLGTHPTPLNLEGPEIEFLGLEQEKIAKLTVEIEAAYEADKSAYFD